MRVRRPCRTQEHRVPRRSPVSTRGSGRCQGSPVTRRAEAPQRVLVRDTGPSAGPHAVIERCLWVGEGEGPLDTCREAQPPVRIRGRISLGGHGHTPDVARHHEFNLAVEPRRRTGLGLRSDSATQQESQQRDRLSP